MVTWSLVYSSISDRPICVPHPLEFAVHVFRFMRLWLEHQTSWHGRRFGTWYFPIRVCFLNLHRCRFSSHICRCNIQQFDSSIFLRWWTYVKMPYIFLTEPPLCSLFDISIFAAAENDRRVTARLQLTSKLPVAWPREMPFRRVQSGWLVLREWGNDL